LPVDELVALPGFAPLHAPLAVHGEPVVATPTVVQLSVVLFLIATSVALGLKSTMLTWAEAGAASPKAPITKTEAATSALIFMTDPPEVERQGFICPASLDQRTSI
jgi:hypothetical protein